MTINLKGGVDTLNLANVVNTGTVAGVEKINGNAAADTITISTSVTAGMINLGAGIDSLVLQGSLNTLQVLNVESVTGGGGSDTVTNTGTNAMTFLGGGGNDSFIAGGGVDTIVIDHDGAGDLMSIKSFRVAGGDKIALDIAGVNTFGGDTFDIGGSTLVNGTNITSVADFDTLLATTLNNGGNGGFAYEADTGNLFYSATGDFSGGGTLIATITASGATPWVYDIAGFMVV